MLVMEFHDGAILVGSALLAGAMNAVAGGGSFFSFPALIVAHVPPIQANATSTVALWPGSVASAGAFRKRMPRNHRLMTALTLISLVGGIVGALLLLRTPQGTFMRMLPFLFLAATLLFAFGGKLAKLLAPADALEHATSWKAVIGASLVQIVIAVYGGFFGGGIGILMLAMLSVVGMRDIHEMNAIKTLLATAINGVAVIMFIAAGAVYWPQALLMMMGAIAGGYAGGHYSQKLNPLLVRRFVIAIGFGMSAYFFWQQWR